MASGSSGRSGNSAKGFDFGTDDVLCSYDDFDHQESANGKRMDSSGLSNSTKDFRESRNGRSLIDVYTPQEESGSRDIISAVDRTMKKYTDTMLRVLDGMSGRLSQLELYCYNLERSIGDFRSDIVRDQSETDQKFRSVEKHLQEVHRSVQILRDKQELADAQKELAKLQMMQKESTTEKQSHHSEERVAQSAAEPHKQDNSSEPQNQQLALALPHQIHLPPQPQTYKEVPVQQSLPPPLAPQTIPVQTPTPYYSQQSQVPSQSHPNVHPQAEVQYVNQRPQIAEPPRQAVPQPQPPAKPTIPQPYLQYQQQWPQHVQPPQPASLPQVRPQTPPAYSTYPTQPSNPAAETFPNSMPVQVPFSGASQQTPSRPDAVGYGYGGPSRTIPQQQLHLNMQRQLQLQQQPPSGQIAYGAHLGEAGFPSAGPPAPQSNIHGYMMYETEGSRVPLPPHYPQGSYPQPTPSSNVGGRHPPQQLIRNHPYTELIEKAVNMGYARDQVANALHRMEESGQPLDFNTLLDRLNSTPQRGW
ncbi:RNA polymerase II degradation factor 1-like [Aristolochia californica]|uniref:RNA polymerase II degradation factor 1-like n=1 Tax=Aristolochia californica TaxID=171875 RepID=UPI0035E0CE6D